MKEIKSTKFIGTYSYKEGFLIDIELVSSNIRGDFCEIYLYDENFSVKLHIFDIPLEKNHINNELELIETLRILLKSEDFMGEYINNFYPEDYYENNWLYQDGDVY